MKQDDTTLAQVKLRYASKYIPYQILLSTKEWKDKRDIIVRRDKGMCANCGTHPTDSFWSNGKMHHLQEINSASSDESELRIIQYDSAIVLHVHHTYYVIAKYPWEYENDALVTLCDECHMNVHKTSTIPVYRIEGGKRVAINSCVCSRCHGAGFFPQYNHVQSGVCFSCEGRRYINTEL